jgi:GTP-binding protein HflX
VLNKVDRIPVERLPLLEQQLPLSIPVSAQERTGLDALRDRLASGVAASFVPVKVNIPYGRAELVSLFRARGMVDKEDHRADGTLITGRLPSALLSSFLAYIS